MHREWKKCFLIRDERFVKVMTIQFEALYADRKYDQMGGIT